jgi:hypothetical protein
MRKDMLRDEILNLGATGLRSLILEKFGVALKGLDDFENLGVAWQIVEKLDCMGWAVDIRNMKGRKIVDAFSFAGDGPVTIFARHGDDPDFVSVVEGICKTGLIILEENNLAGVQ